MSKKIQSVIQKIQKKSRSLTNNTQKVGLRLLANGGWVPRSKLVRIPSATARIRDLRKKEFGSFPVECRSSSELGKKSSKPTYYYRINTSKVNQKQLETLFRQSV